MGRVCMRGRCSVITRSPPKKSFPGCLSNRAAAVGLAARSPNPEAYEPSLVVLEA
jgi:hypothetical protein